MFSDIDDYKWDLTREEKDLVLDFREKERQKEKWAMSWAKQNIKPILFELAHEIDFEHMRLLAHIMWQSPDKITQYLSDRIDALEEKRKND